MKAVAAMALNRTIGRANRIPWHLPEDFRWFKRLTAGHVVLMGRQTLESLGRALPQRLNVVATRQAEHLAGDADFARRFGPVQMDAWEASEAGAVCLVGDLERFLTDFATAAQDRELFLIGGAQLYAQLLDRCTDLYLSVVFQEVEGDAFFPLFEDRFALYDVPLRQPQFEVRHYRHVSAPPPAPGGDVGRA